MLALALQLALAPPQQPPSDFARAESLLASGRLTEARAATERLLRRSPDDPRLLTLLGRIHLDWPVFGRYAAESLFVRASRLDPANPEPFYWIGRTGLALGGDDGEMMSRPALLEVLRLQPDYRDAWELWLRLYRGDAERRDAVEALEAHAGSAGADLKRSQLLLELRDYPRALALLDSAVRARPNRVEPLALLARALFESGADSAGARTYELALRLAHLDTDSVLWKQVRGIATPREREEYLRIGPGEREDFLRLFWARRDPHLASPLNERMGEHFRRMAEARRQFALLHPNARYHRSRLWRALAGGLGEPPGPELRGVIDAARATPCVAELPTAAVEVLSGTMSAGSLDSAGQTTVNLEDALDDRGRIWLRYGPPEQRFVHSTDAETWCYERPEGRLRVTFIRRTGGWGLSGDVVVAPVLSSEVPSARYLLSTDRPSLEATLSFSFWPATFRSVTGRGTDLYLFPDSVSATAVLLDSRGREAARDTATARALRATVAGGLYHLLVDAERGGQLGRYRGAIAVPDYHHDSLAVSSLLLAPGQVAASRSAMVAAAPAGLRLPARTPLRVYGEIYGLGRTEGMARYEVRYSFEPLRGRFHGLGPRPRTTVITFVREVAHAAEIVESVVIDPGRLPPGRYRLTVQVNDLARRATATTAAVHFDLR